MTYILETTERYEKQFAKLDRSSQIIISKWLVKNIDGTSDPRSKGKALNGERTGTWRYRIGDYRVIVQIQDEKLIVLALEVGHRRDVYL